VSDENPPGGMGWIPLVDRDGGSDPTIAWLEVREFGGVLYGRIRDSLQRPAFYVAAVDRPRRKRPDDGGSR
jgi:hypothetical protein